MALEQVCSLDYFRLSERIFAQAKGILAQARFPPKLKLKKIKNKKFGPFVLID